ncbi:hypothetical protein HEQ72_01975 [Haematospirillum sp. 15-248]|uniref:hypothetical protein n=1 Tax=Haematospirillum sp. 15-248 TaxID=2723107 RepID=UPI00143916A5|nr:hypothetical protein [Haematospirillum sp. 15-248]NKD87083.1 hypothetical protein [Haematospirillum sp. 15-248]
MKKSLCAFAVCVVVCALGFPGLGLARNADDSRDGAVPASSVQVAASGKDGAKGAQSQRAAKKAPSPAVSGECAWIGKRVLSLLSRDDVDQANRFMNFYRLFGCKESHIGPSFRCVISDASAGALNAEDMAARVDRCWNSPL